MKNRVVILTGAFGALGRVVARTLAETGAHVALVDAARTAPTDLPADALPLPGVDLADFAATQAMVGDVQRAFGRLDALVNVAGGFRWETVEGGDIATWDLMYAMNLKTALHACKAALPSLLASGRGCIVNIGAASANKAAMGMGAYAASKAGVMRLTETLAEEGKDRGLTANAILPGIIDTPTNRKDMPDADFNRWVAPQAIADVVAFLLSDAARSVTGAGIPVTGRL